MNNITSYRTSDLLDGYYESPYKWNSPISFRLKEKEIKTPCVLIFGPNQAGMLETLKNKLPKNKKIIFEGKKAVNQREGTYGGVKQRNTIIVIDKCEDETLSSLP